MLRLALLGLLLCTVPCITALSADYRRAIKQSLAPWASSTGITEHGLKRVRKAKGVVRYQIRGGELYRAVKCYFPARCRGIEHVLLALAPELPDLDLAINVRDQPVSYLKYQHEGPPLPVFSFSTVPGVHADILYPAWGFWEGGPHNPAVETWQWPTMRATLLAAADATPWAAKLPRAFFRGSRTSLSRDGFYFHSKRNDSERLFDFELTRTGADPLNAYTQQVMGVEFATSVALEEHCRYKYLLNFDGMAASFRLKNILLCGSVVLWSARSWTEFFYHGLEPWVHYVPVADARDAAEQIRRLEADDALARRIALAGQTFVRDHLRMEEVAEYWRELLLQYAKLQRFEVKKSRQLVKVRDGELHARFVKHNKRSINRHGIELRKLFGVPAAPLEGSSSGRPAVLEDPLVLRRRQEL